MKSITSTILPLIMLSLFSFYIKQISAQPMDNAGNYLGYYNDMYKPIQKDMWDYTSAIAKGKKAKIVEKRRQELITTLRTSEVSVKKSKGFKGDNGLKDGVEGWMAASQIILKEDYEKIMNLEEVAEDSYDNMETYMKAKEIASDHMREKSELLTQEVERFAEQYNVNLIQDDSRLSKKLDRADEVFKYYNQIYLVFFKSYKQEAYLLNAVSQNDINGIEQNKATLAKFAAEGKSKLNGIRNINSDVSVKNACRTLLDFYISESGKDMEVVTNFILEKESFDNIQKAFEAKKKSQRTKSDIDKYNQAINKINEASDNFNKTIDKLNKERSDKLNDYNNAVDRFLNKYAS